MSFIFKYFGMDILDCIRLRRSIRNYVDKQVEWDKVGAILQAGVHAPSSGNLQNWKFIVVIERDTRKKIAEACLQQYWMEKAPVHIIVVAEPQKARQFYGIRGERLYSIQNCAAAIENMLLVAKDNGLGSCWVGAFDEDMLNSVLGMPDYVRPQAVITVGYAAEEPEEPPEYRVYDMVFVERWGNKIRDAAWYLKDYAWAVEKNIKRYGKELKEKGVLEKGASKVKSLFKTEKKE